MSVFLDYNKKVKYDYIFKVSMLINKEFDNIHNIENLLIDEDYMKLYFKEVGLGRVYSDIVKKSNLLIMRFGISEIDKESDLNSKTLKDDIIEFILSFNKEIDFFKENNIERSDIKVQLLKDKESFDRKLVNEGKLIFESDKLEEIKLTDEGKVEYSINNELKESFDFSKQKVNSLCEDLMNNGSTLKDNENIDLDQTERDIQDSIEKVDHIQELKDELIDKMDHLVNESKEDNKKFPSSNKTDKKLCLNEIEEDKILMEYLSDDQLSWIEDNICNRHQFNEGFKDLWNLVTVDPNEPLISIDEYINEIMKGDNEND